MQLKVNVTSIDQGQLLSESNFLTKLAGDLTVPRLPKLEAAKVIIYSHCAIPLLHHTHPKKQYPILSNL